MLSYTVDELNDALRAIIARGTEVDQNGVAHKRNMLDPHAPLLPVKFHLCTEVARPARAGSPRLTGADVSELGRLLWLKLKSRGKPYPKISGIPRAGAALAKAMESAAWRDGVELRLVELTKEAGGAFKFKVEEPAQSELWPLKPAERELWAIDDLIHFGDTKGAALRAWRTAGYHVKNMLVVLDYGRGGRRVLKHWGVELHELAEVRSLLEIAECEPELNPKLTAEILGSMHAHLTPQPALAAS